MAHTASHHRSFPHQQTFRPWDSETSLPKVRLRSTGRGLQKCSQGSIFCLLLPLASRQGWDIVQSNEAQIQPGYLFPLTQRPRRTDGQRDFWMNKHRRIKLHKTAWTQKKIKQRFSKTQLEVENDPKVCSFTVLALKQCWYRDLGSSWLQNYKIFLCGL